MGMNFVVSGYYKSSICDAGWPLDYTEEEFSEFRYALRYIETKSKDSDWVLEFVTFFYSEECWIDFTLDDVPDQFQTEYQNFLAEKEKKISMKKKSKPDNKKGKKKRH